VDNSSTAQYVTGYDGKGNLTVLIDAINNVSPSANIKLQIEYGPYGEMLYSKGSLSPSPFRYQTNGAWTSKTAVTTAINLYDTLAAVLLPSLWPMDQS
jgi:hypothetical protein